MGKAQLAIAPPFEIPSLYVNGSKIDLGRNLAICYTAAILMEEYPLNPFGRAGCPFAFFYP